jgi:hypothetical protein
MEQEFMEQIARSQEDISDFTRRWSLKKRGGRIVYLIMAMKVVFLESEFEVYVMCTGVSL